MNPLEELMKKLSGQTDSKSLTGILSRGKNVYNATASHAHSGGGPQFGRPSKNAIMRRLYGRSS